MVFRRLVGSSFKHQPTTWALRWVIEVGPVGCRGGLSLIPAPAVVGVPSAPWSPLLGDAWGAARPPRKPDAAGHDLVGPLADLGITWWDERMPWGDDLERTEPILRRIEQGPPRI